MQRVTAVLLFLLLAGLSSGEEGKSVPQPRLKLDPTAYTAVPAPVNAAQKSADAVTTTIMDRYVVRDQGLMYLLKRRPAVEDPTGRFTLQDGGRVGSRRVGPFLVEFGLWPHVEIFAEDARFKPPQTTANFDVLRIKW